MAFNPSASLVGMFFVIDSEIEQGWQGYVEADLGNGYFLAQIYSWLSGEPTCSKVISLKQASSTDWDWYSEKEHWQSAAQETSARISERLKQKASIKELAGYEATLEGLLAALEQKELSVEGLRQAMGCAKSKACVLVQEAISKGLIRKLGSKRGYAINNLDEDNAV